MTTEGSHHGVRKLLGGTLKAHDPRRYLVEVMVGAMHADGHVDPREHKVLERLLAEHELFSSLSGKVDSVLIDMAADAVTFAGGVERRIERIANCMPLFVHRLGAFAMACEIVAADEVVAEDERGYLDTLQRVFCLSDRVRSGVLAAARRGKAMPTVENESERMRAFLALVIEVCVLRRRLVGPVRPSDVELIGDALGGVSDLVTDRRDLERELSRVALGGDTAAPRDIPTRLASASSDRCDYYWLTVYLMAVDAARGSTEWRETELYPLLGTSLGLSEAELDRAWAHASQLAER